MKTEWPTSPGTPPAPPEPRSPGSPPPGVATGLGTLRGRLISAFTLVVLLPMIVITAVQMVSGSVGGRQDLLDQLETVTTYKQAAIEYWLNALTVELANTLIGENTLTDIQTLVQNPPNSPNYAIAREAYLKLHTRFNNLLIQSQLYDEIFLMNVSGRVILSTQSALEGQVYSTQTYFQRGLVSPYVNPPFYSPGLGKTVLIAVYPVKDETGQVLAMVAGRARLAPLTAILNGTAGLGQTGVTYLVGSDRRLLAGLRPEDEGAVIATLGVQNALTTQKPGRATYLNPSGVRVLGVYRWVPSLEAAFLTEQHTLESSRPIYAVMAVSLSVALASLIIALVVSLSVTHSIAAPIAELAAVATQIAAGSGRGDRSLTPTIQSAAENAAEINTLALAFTSMTAQLNNLIGNLEQRVAERTYQLTQRTNYLEASARVSQAAASILDPNALITQAVDLIRSHFDLYYTGLFLLDEKREWALLRAGTGPAGQAMLARGHRLRLGEASMIAWSITNAQPRIALQAGEDPIRLATAELPDTRSEAALPLRSRGQVIGAITVQSHRPNAFDEATISVLQTMADQLAIALDNAHLFAESQNALEAERRVYGELSRTAWQQWIQRLPQLGYRSDGRTLTPAGETWYPEMQAALTRGETILPPVEPRPENAHHSQSHRAHPIAIPIKVRGQVIGVIDTCKPPESGPWTAEEINLLQTICEQLGLALDSARLFQDTQNRAARERLIGEATGRMRETLDIETVLQTAALEMRRALGLAEVEMRLRPPTARQPRDPQPAGQPEQQR